MDNHYTICYSCKHLGKNTNPDAMTDDQVANGAACTAFPDGIPDEIWLKMYDHRRPFGNETVLFSLEEDPYLQVDAESNLKMYEKMKALYKKFFPAET